MSTAAGSPGSSAVRVGQVGATRPREPGPARLVDLGIAGDDIGELRSCVVARAPSRLRSSCARGRVGAPGAEWRARTSAAAARAAARECGPAERQHGETVQDREHGRRGQEPGPDRRRTARGSSGLVAPVQPIGRDGAAQGWCRGVHGVQRADRAVAVVDARRRLRAGVARSRCRRRGVASAAGCAESAVAVEHFDGPPRRAPSRCRLGAACRPLSACGRHHGAGDVDDRVQHLHERAGERQVRPARIGGHMEQHDAAAAARARRDQRRAVAQFRPDLGVAQAPAGRRGPGASPSRPAGPAMSGERSGRRERSRSAAAPPRRASRRARARPAAARTGSSASIVGAGEVRAGEADAACRRRRSSATSRSVVSGGSVPVSVRTMTDAPRSISAGDRLAGARRRRSG